MLGMSVKQIPKLIRDGLLDRVKGQFPSLSRTQVEEQAHNPRLTEWVTSLRRLKFLVCLRRASAKSRTRIFCRSKSQRRAVAAFGARRSR